MTEVPEKVRDAYQELPPGWKLEKLKFFAGVRNSNVDKTVSEDEVQVRLCNYTDVYYNDRITADLPFMEGSATKAEIERFQLKRDQVIITKDSEGWDDIGIPALVTEDMPNVLCGYHLSVFEPGTELDGSFLAWLCRAEPLNAQFKLAANGVTRFGLGQYPMKNAFIAFPPLDTQRRIARFLDEKTAQIDGLIEKKRALLDRLAEKRQALITRAVTKGLNPDAPLKPSGIDWLGDIPAHWEFLPLRRMVLLQRGHDLPSHEREDGDVLLVSSAGVTGRHSTQISDGPGIVTGRYGTIGAFYYVDAPYWPLNTTLYSKEIRCHPEFGFWVLQAMSHLFVLNSLKSAVPGVDRNDILSEAVPRPPLTEQRTISNEIDRKEKQALAHGQLVKSSIRLLEEYRGALITAAVTGQIAGLQ